jgi:AraC-like DNA-binding protein
MTPIPDPTAAKLVRPAMIARIVPTCGRLVLPDVRCDLLWRRGRFLFCGPLTHGRASFATDEPLIVASFDPIMIRRWLDIPLSLVTDRIVPLGDVAPHLEAALGEQFLKGAMKAIGLPTDAIRISEQNIRLDAAAAELRRSGSVREAADCAGVSERQLERLFEIELGMRPKLFARILRLRRAIMLVGKGATLADAATASGYADQSHFNRNTQSLVGGTPSTILRHVGNVQDILHGTVAD